jgi:hypothetical protein
MGQNPRYFGKRDFLKHEQEELSVLAPFVLREFRLSNVYRWVTFIIKESLPRPLREGV